MHGMVRVKRNLVRVFDQGLLLPVAHHRSRNEVVKTGLEESVVVSIDCSTPFHETPKVGCARAAANKEKAFKVRQCVSRDPEPDDRRTSSLPIRQLNRPPLRLSAPGRG